MGRSKEPRLVAEGEPGGWIADSDDEEIDEDGAFDSDDEVAYGGFFAGGKSSGEGETKGGSKMLNSDASVDDDGSDDESAGGSDDEGESDENDWAGSDDSDADDDGGQYMLDLLNNLDQPAASSGTDKSPKKGGKIQLGTPASEAAARLPEDEFNAGALAAMSSDAGNTKLTLDSLMGEIGDTAGFTAVQRSMRSLSGSAQPTQGEGKSKQTKKLATTSVPVARVVSDRASRKVHYEATTEETSRWKDAVHEQRDAETLDFRTNKGGATTNRITRDTLVEKFEATTDFERELQEALEKAGADDESKLRKAENKLLTGTEDVDADDDLGAHQITLAEYRKRHGELAKLRALMFHEEQKRHRINKIKSKKYRKIRKRRRERERDAEADAAKLDDVDGVLEREQREREEMDRMKERMTLAHRNTSKWARRVLRRGAKMDVEERRALSLQIAKGEELRRKVMGEEDGGDSGDESETEEGLLKRARDILMEDEGGDDEGKGKKKGLFQLEFMKRGMEAQRARAKAEARKLLEELEANELPSDSDEDDCDKTEGEAEDKQKKKKVATEEETKKVLTEGELVASSLKFGKADGFAVRVDGDIELGDKAKEGEDDANEEAEAGKGKKKRRKRKKKGGEVAAVDGPSSGPATTEAVAKEEDEEENPWIVSKGAKKSSKPLSRTVNIGEAASMLVDDAKDQGQQGKRKREDAGVKSDEPEADKAGEAATEPAVDKEEVGVAELSQAELVRRAFAAPTDLEAEEEFQKEKERMKERDDPTRKKKEEKVVSGWGSWAGAGAPPPKKPRKLPSKLQAPKSKKAANTAPKRKDDGMSTVIINEKRLKKTAKFQLSEVPYPYRSREEYERAIAGNIGREWNTMNGTKEMSRPAVLVRAGKIIQPIAKKAKSKPRRAPAKF